MIFETLLPQDLATLKQKVKVKGDINVVKSNSAMLKELNEEENRISSNKGNEHSKRRAEFTLEDLKEELRLDFDASLKGNFEAFEGKFNLYHRQLKDDLSKAIEEANNRVITAVREGPHDKIKNEVSSLYLILCITPSILTNLAVHVGTQDDMERNGRMAITPLPCSYLSFAMD